MIETVCPRCGVPRPRDAKQCVCNYTFEYGKLPATAPRARPGGAGAGKPGADRVLLGLVALVAALAVVGWFNASVGQAERSRPELGLFMIGAGIFSVCGSIFAWEFFLSHRRARLLALFLGRTGTRTLYAILGGAFAGAGFALGFL